MNFILYVYVVYIWFQALMFCLFLLKKPNSDFSRKRIEDRSGGPQWWIKGWAVWCGSGYTPCGQWILSIHLGGWQLKYCLFSPRKLFERFFQLDGHAYFCNFPLVFKTTTSQSWTWNIDWNFDQLIDGIVSMQTGSTGVLLVKAVSDRKGVRVGKGAGSSRIRIRRELCHRFFNGDSEIKTCHLKVWKSFPQKIMQKVQVFSALLHNTRNWKKRCF